MCSFCLGPTLAFSDGVEVLTLACAMPDLDFVMSIGRVHGGAGTRTAQACRGDVVHRFPACLENLGGCEKSCAAQPHGLSVLNICLTGDFGLFQLL